MELSLAPNISPCSIFAPLPSLTELCASLGVPHLPTHSMYPSYKPLCFLKDSIPLGYSHSSHQQQWAGLLRIYQAWGHPGDWQGKVVVQPERAHRHLCCCCCFGEPGQWG